MVECSVTEWIRQTIRFYLKSKGIDECTYVARIIRIVGMQPDFREPIGGWIFVMILLCIFFVHDTRRSVPIGEANVFASRAIQRFLLRDWSAFGSPGIFGRHEFCSEFPHVIAKIPRRTREEFYFYEQARFRTEIFTSE